MGPTKNQHRNAPLPLHKIVGDAFLAWRHATKFKTDGDWVFPLESSAGEIPEYSNNLQSHMLAPAGKAIGLLSFGLAHSQAQLQGATQAVYITIQRDLMRHADTSTTMNDTAPAEWIACAPRTIKL